MENRQSKIVNLDRFLTPCELEDELYEKGTGLAADPVLREKEIESVVLTRAGGDLV